MSERYIGADIGGTKIAYGLFDAERRLLASYKFPSSSELDCEPFFDMVVEHIRSILRENGISPNELAGVGVGVPSFVEYETGRIVTTANLAKIRDFAALDYLAARLNTRVVLDNDANASALAEFRYGAGKGCRHMVYCPVSTGCSSAIIINGTIFHGSYGWAGESGHGVITPGEDFHTGCGCGNDGCFMSHISGAMIVKRIRRRLEAGDASVMTELCGGDLDKLSAETLLEAYRLGDGLAAWAIEHMARYMGLWLFNIFQILNIKTFVFGGGLVHFGDALFGRARQVFDSYEKSGCPVEFKFAELKEETGVIGAAELLFTE